MLQSLEGAVISMSTGLQLPSKPSHLKGPVTAGAPRAAQGLETMHCWERPQAFTSLRKAAPSRHMAVIPQGTNVPLPPWRGCCGGCAQGRTELFRHLGMRTSRP